VAQMRGLELVSGGLVNEQQGQQSSQVDAGKVFVQEVELSI